MHELPYTYIPDIVQLSNSFVLRHSTTVHSFVLGEGMFISYFALSHQILFLIGCSARNMYCTHTLWTITAEIESDLQG